MVLGSLHFILGFFLFFSFPSESPAAAEAAIAWRERARARSSLSLPLSFEIDFVRGFASTIEREENCRRKTEAIFM